MKKIQLICLALLCVVTATAQKFTQSLEGIEWVKIESSASVIVETHNSNELLIEREGNYKIPDRAKGLKLIGEDGKDNTDVGFYVTKDGNSLIVRNLKKSRVSKIFLPASQNISVTTNWNGSIEMHGFKGEIEATAKINGSVKLKDISGPLTANSLNGSIHVVFSKVSQASPITIFSTNGALDISMPEQTPADVSLGSTNGSIYSNFDFEIPKKNGLTPIATKKIKGEINNGGVNVQLKTTNGNIYLRKQ